MPRLLLLIIGKASIKAVSIAGHQGADDRYRHKSRQRGVSRLNYNEPFHRCDLQLYACAPIPVANEDQDDDPRKKINLNRFLTKHG